MHIPLELANFNVFRAAYFKRADEAGDKLAAQYKNFHNIEQLINGFPELFDEQLSSMVTTAVEDLIHNRIYTVDAEKFWNRHVKDIQAYHVFSDLEDQYEAILEDQAEKNAYRTQRRRNRGRWVGGGFGMQGAIKGAVQAGVLNAGGAIAHGTANVIGSAFSALGTSAKKLALFSDKRTCESIMSACRYDLRRILFTFTDFMRENGFRIKAVTVKELDEAETMFHSITSPSFPREDVLNAMIKTILINPYIEKYYYFLIDRFGDERGEVEALAKYFHIDVAEYKVNIIRKRFQKLPVSTLEEALRAKEDIETMCKKLGGVPNVIKKEIQDIIEEKKYQKVYDSYAAHPKNTLSQWNACRQEIEKQALELKLNDRGSRILQEIDSKILDFKTNELKALFQSSPKSTEREAIAAKEAMLQLCNEMNLSPENPVMAEIDTVLQAIDREIRSVDGIVMDSREQAAIAKEEKERLQTLLQTPRHYRNDWVLMLRKIEQDFTTPIKTVYITKLQKELKQFERQYRAASRYEYRRVRKNPVYSGDARHIMLQSLLFLAMLTTMLWPVYFIYLFFFERKREKKTWNKLTENGTLPFTDLWDKTQLCENTPDAITMEHGSSE